MTLILPVCLVPTLKGNNYILPDSLCDCLVFKERESTSLLDYKCFDLWLYLFKLFYNIKFKILFEQYHFEICLWSNLFTLPLHFTKSSKYHFLAMLIPTKTTTKQGKNFLYNAIYYTSIRQDRGMKKTKKILYLSFISTCGNLLSISWNPFSTKHPTLHQNLRWAQCKNKKFRDFLLVWLPRTNFRVPTSTWATFLSLLMRHDFCQMLYIIRNEIHKKN